VDGAILKTAGCLERPDGVDEVEGVGLVCSAWSAKFENFNIVCGATSQMNFKHYLNGVS
jgi:hypothetical protein